MRVKNLRRGRHAARELEGGFAEENEARGIIGIRLALLAVKGRAIEELVAADEENLEILSRARLE